MALTNLRQERKYRIHDYEKGGRSAPKTQSREMAAEKGEENELGDKDDGPHEG